MKRTFVLALTTFIVFCQSFRTFAQEQSHPAQPRVTIELPNGKATEIPKGSYDPDRSNMQ
ncbi:MAG: hypothetical protein H7Y10_07120 [Flavobacterium sp.]|nr:hypothetical protein [Flavobacterium sp.]